MVAILEARTTSSRTAKNAALLSWGPGEGPNPETTHPGPHEPGPVGFRAKQKVVDDPNHPIPWLPHSVGQRVRASTLEVGPTDRVLAYVPPDPDSDQQDHRPWPNAQVRRVA